MKKNFNIIQIKGIRGLVFAGLVVCCLFAGFIIFPGWVGMQLWNISAANSFNIPQIGLFQGVLLWGILVASYFTFRKEKVVVCMKAQQGLNEDELKAVFADMKKQAQYDPILQAMMKAREAELKYKAQKDIETETSEIEVNAGNDSTKVS